MIYDSVLQLHRIVLAEHAERTKGVSISPRDPACMADSLCGDRGD